MFEKEAEEYVDLSGNRNYTERAFKDGAEFGYNKAEKELAKAKEIITNLVKSDWSYKDDEEYQRECELYDKMWEEAEQFLNEVGE